MNFFVIIRVLCDGVSLKVRYFFAARNKVFKIRGEGLVIKQVGVSCYATGV